MSAYARAYMTRDGLLFRALVTKPNGRQVVVGPYPTAAPAKAVITRARRAGSTAVLQVCTPYWVDRDV